MLDWQTGNRLQVPTMEKIGTLRQNVDPGGRARILDGVLQSGQAGKARARRSMWWSVLSERRADGRVIQPAAAASGGATRDAFNHDEERSKMSKLSLASYLALSLAVGWYAPEAAAVKVERDPTVSANPVPPQKKGEPQAVAPAPDLPKLTAAQIADKNVAARGGLTAWRAVQSIKMTGRMEVGGKANNELPFTLQMKRPNKQRLTIEFAGQTAVQGVRRQGWLEAAPVF